MLAQVSVIVPVYNVAEYLPECIESIINQTYKNLEIILVDDGSTDGSERICDEYAKNDQRITMIHQTNSGVSRARLNGFTHSTGDYIMFVDSDDFIDKKMVETMMRSALDKNVDLVCCQYFDYRHDLKKTLPTVCRPGTGYYERSKIETLLKTNFLWDYKLNMAGMNLYLVCKLIKRSYVQNALKKSGDLSWGEDQVGVLQILYDIESMVVIPDALYFYRKRVGQVTQTYYDNVWDKVVDCLKTIKKNDINNFLAEQIPQRCLAMLFILIKMAFEAGDTTKKIKHNIARYVKQLPETLTVQVINLNFKDRLKYCFLKYNMLGCYKILLKVKRGFNRES